MVIRKWSLDSFVTVLKILTFFILLWHTSSCLWFYINLIVGKDPKNQTWFLDNQLETKTFSEKYIFAIYYTMMIVTAGYGDLLPTNDIERIWTMILILLGDALFAFAFGMMASLALKLDPKDSLKGFMNDTEKYKKILNKHKVKEEI